MVTEQRVFAGVESLRSKSTGSCAGGSPLEPLQNVGSAQAGARILFCTDEWFASSDNLIRDEAPTFDPHSYCAQGKVMDGWESRRRREAGHDWCIIRLSSRARLLSVTLDTAHFTGNHVPAVSLQAADLTLAREQALISQFPGILPRLLYGGQQGTGCAPSEVKAAETACSSVPWETILPHTRLNPGYEATRHHQFAVLRESSSIDSTTATTTMDAVAVQTEPLESKSDKGSAIGIIATHVRLNYYPDGGVARLRLWGIPTPQQQQQLLDAPVALYVPIQTGPSCTVVSHDATEDCRSLPLPSQQRDYAIPEVSGADQGGVGVSCSNQHYGVPSNLIQACSGVDMGDGWETARHPNRPSVLVVQTNSSGLVDWTLSDWCILKLGTTVSFVDRIIVDTKHFKGNYPESVQVDGCCCRRSLDNNEKEDHAILASIEWFPLLARGRMSPHSEHCYEASKDQISNAIRPVSHVRISIYPDGGISRVRVYGEPMR